MTELRGAAKVLGVVGSNFRFTSNLDYMNLVDRGLPLKSLDIICQAIAPSDVNFKYRIVPKATLARAKSRRKLSAVQSVLVTRLASIWWTAQRIWKTPEKARDFLSRPHPLLEGRRPIDLVLENEIGAELVRDVLGRLEHGSAV